MQENTGQFRKMQKNIFTEKGVGVHELSYLHHGFAKMKQIKKYTEQYSKIQKKTGRIHKKYRKLKFKLGRYNK